MREIVKGHGGVWVAQKAAELGYLLPSTISSDKVPLFNFWLERYTNVPFERYVLALYRSGDFNMADTLPPEQRPMLEREMEERDWFEKHLEDFTRELEPAVDYIAAHLADRKNMKRCLKSLPACCYNYLVDWADADWTPVDGLDIEDDDDDDGLMRFSCVIFREEWDGMRRLQEEGYIIIQEDDYDDELNLKLYDAFTDMAAGKKPEFNEDDEDKSGLADTLESFIYMKHVNVAVPKSLLKAVKGLLTGREETRLKERSLAHDLVNIVNRFYGILSMDDILKIAQEHRKIERYPDSVRPDQETLIRNIRKLRDSKVEEIEGITYEISYPLYREHVRFQKRYGQMTLQEYQKAIEADDELYDTVYEYLMDERFNDISPTILPSEVYSGFSVFGFLALKGPYLRLFSLLSVILMEERHMDSMFASMVNGASHGDDEGPFHREVDSPEVYLQRAYDLLYELGTAMLYDVSLTALVGILQNRVGLAGLKRETQEQLLDLLRACYKYTPNPDFRGDYPDEDTCLIEDFDLDDIPGEHDEEYEDEDDFESEYADDDEEEDEQF